MPDNNGGIFSIPIRIFRNEEIPRDHQVILVFKSDVLRRHLVALIKIIRAIGHISSLKTS